jgi:hypothetical protein
MKLSGLLPSIQEKSLSSLVGKNTYIQAKLRNQTNTQNLSNIDPQVKSKLADSNDTSVYLLDMRVDSINFKDWREGYVVRLQVPSGEFEDFLPTESRNIMCFSYIGQHNCYSRGIGDDFKSIRDMSKIYGTRDSSKNPSSVISYCPSLLERKQGTSSYCTRKYRGCIEEGKKYVSMSWNDANSRNN